METLEPKIRGYGIIEIGDRKINFENKVNINFVLACQAALDGSGLTLQGSTTNVRNVNAFDFSLLEEATDISMQSAYTQLAKIPMSSFKLIQATLFKSTIKASGTILKSGIMRTAGFNVIRKMPEGELPTMSIFSSQRVPTISIQAKFTIPTRGGWIYHNKMKALYLFTSPNIYKVPFNIDTGELGTVSIISTNWGTVFPYFINTTDGRNKKMISTSEDNMKIFDFLTETVQDVALDPDIYNSVYGASFELVWDDHLQQLRTPQRRMYKGNLIEGFTLTLTGDITVNTGIFTLSTDVLCFKKDYWLTENNINAYNYGLNTPIISLGKITNSHYNSRSTRIMDEFNVTVLAEFNTTINPTSLALIIYKEPDTSMTILPLEEMQVFKNQNFSIEYTFEVTKGE